jgi:radical SAM superfamily enzyme YgiQ (UPF0313 family)
MSAASRRSGTKVMLVEPASVESNVFSAFAGLPLLGPLYLGTILSRRGFDVTVVNEDLLDRRLGFADLDADVLCLSCITPTVERGYELAALFKRRNPAGRVIMGGPHVSFMAEEALTYADHVVVGEGENVIEDLIGHGSDEPVIHGTPVEDLDALPFIDWDLLVNFDRLRIQPFMFSRGCPFACNFCSVTAMFGRRYRSMSPERVLAEVDTSRRRDVFFYDDNFAAKRTRTHRILDGLVARAGGQVRWWSAQVRADLTRDEEMLRKMARSGCGRVYVGFESINDATLREMHKGQSAEDVRRAIRLFHKHVIRVHGMFVFGSDSDDEQVLRATGEFVRRTRMDSVQYMLLTPFPGTNLFERIEREGRLLHRMWRYYDAMHVVFQPRAFEPYELQELTMSIYGDYYSVLRAMNDGIEAAASATARMAGRAAERFGAPSHWNVLYKVMGSHIIRRWMRGNHDYLRYLRFLPAQG